jgi:hypothetical protein
MDNIHFPDTHTTDHIIIEMGHDNLWLSLIEIHEIGYQRKELALIRRYSTQRTECVPVRHWFDASQDETELAIDLLNTHQYSKSVTAEASIMYRAISSAYDYAEFVLPNSNEGDK